MKDHRLSTWVILSGAKDLTQTGLVALKKQRVTNSVGKVPHFVRDDARPRQHRALFAK
jgi:hypothetical protein